VQSRASGAVYAGAQRCKNFICKEQKIMTGNDQRAIAFDIAAKVLKALQAIDIRDRDIIIACAVDIEQLARRLRK